MLLHASKIKMIYRILVYVFLVLLLTQRVTADNDSLSLEYLLKLIDQKEIYMNSKERHVNSLKEELKKVSGGDSLIYTLQKLIYQEYATYKPDSAIKYVVDNLNLSLEKQNLDWTIESRLDLASLYLTTGMYIDSYNMLSSLDSKQLSQKALIKYYDAWKNFYKFYSFNNIQDDYYKEKNDHYRDSLLLQLNQNSNHYQIVYADKLYDHGRREEAKDVLKKILARTNSETHERAVLSYALSKVYEKLGNIDKQRHYLVVSAISDIKNAIKENASMQALATLLIDENEIEAAYKCIKSSMQDAIFSNARFRSYEIAKVYPIIDSAYQDSTNKRREVLTVFLIIVSFLAMFLVSAVVSIYLQMRKIRRVRQQLLEANQELNRLNLQLRSNNKELANTNVEISTINAKLTETNQIKEVYIGQFLDLCSMYISKLEGYQSRLRKMLFGGKTEEVTKLLKSRRMIDQEVKELHSTFDNIFLQLYPNFIEDFNSLLLESEKLTIKKGEILSTELRIFALVRLGITDTSKIASFLHSSTNTIYTYRTKMRNKSAVPREDFDNMVMKIGRINKPSL